MADTFYRNDKAKINSSYQPSEENQKIRELVYRRFHEMKMGRSQYDKDWDKWEMQWEGWREEKSADDWQSNIVSTLSTSIVETIMAEVQQYDIEPPIKARGYEDIPKVAILKEAVKFTKQQGSFKLEEHDVKKDAFIYGSGFGEELLWNDARKVKFAVEKTDKDGKKTVSFIEQDTFSYKGLYFEHVPIRELWFDEAAKTINLGRRQANDCIRRFIMNFEQAKDFLSDPHWNNTGDLEHMIAGGNLSYYQFYQPPGRIDKETEVEILFYWAKRPDMLAIVANDVVIYNGPNPYNHKMLPFVQAYDIKRTNALYHKGEMQLLESIQEELTKIKRGRLDRLHLTIDPMRFVTRSANISEDETMVRPHGIIEVDDINNIKEDRVSDTPQSAYQEEQYLMNDARRVSGIDDGSQSVDRSALTATQFGGLREATLRKIALKLWHIHNAFHVEHTRLRLANILQYWTIPEYEKVLGENKTEAYQEYLQDKTNSGDVVSMNGEQYIKKYPQIRTTGNKLVKQNGQISLIQAKGDHFFVVRPEEVIPYNQGYDVAYDGTPNLPLTKSLEQTKASELLDRLLPVAMQGIGNYDPGKLMDWYVEKWDEDPDGFKAEQQSQGPQQDPAELAQVENQQMLNGESIPPTPFAIPAHTMLHIAFIKSPTIQKLDLNDPAQKSIFDNLNAHALGEIQTIRQRGGQQQLSDGKPSMPIKGVDGQSNMGMKGTPTGSSAGSSPIGGFMRRMLGQN